MPANIQDMSSWGRLGDPTTRASSLLDTASGPASLPASRQAQQDGWSPAAHDIGKRVDDKRWELSVVCDAAEAMRVQFDVIKRPHIALHDIGGASTRRFLAGVAAAMQAPLRTLTIRRQGYGDTLATLEFVDLPTTDGDGQPSTGVRIYSTIAPETDAKMSRQLANVLMGRSQFAVVVVAADAEPQALAVALGSIKEGMSLPAWSNRSVLMLPLREIKGLSSMTAHLSHRKDMDVRIAPTVTRPAEAWNCLRSTWNTVSRDLAEAGEARVMLLADPTRASTMTSARSAARLAEKVAAGKASAEELRRHLEAASSAGASTRAATLDAAAPKPNVVPAPINRPGSRQVGVDRPTSPETVPRAPAWSATMASTGLEVRGQDQMMPVEPAAIPPQPLQPLPSQDAWPALPVEGGPTSTTQETGSRAAFLAAAAAAHGRAQGKPAPQADALAVSPTNSSMPAAAQATDALRDFVTQCAAIKGMKSCCVVDVNARQMVTGHGLPGDASFASDSTRLTNAMRAAALAFQLPGKIPEAALTYDQHHVVILPLPHDERLAFIGILDKAEVNAAMVQIKLQRLAGALVGDKGVPLKLYGQR